MDVRVWRGLGAIGFLALALAGAFYGATHEPELTASGRFGVIGAVMLFVATAWFLGVRATLGLGLSWAVPEMHFGKALGLMVLARVMDLVLAIGTFVTGMLVSSLHDTLSKGFMALSGVGFLLFFIGLWMIGVAIKTQVSRSGPVQVMRDGLAYMQGRVGIRNPRILPAALVVAIIVAMFFHNGSNVRVRVPW